MLCHRRCLLLALAVCVLVLNGCGRRAGQEPPLERPGQTAAAAAPGDALAIERSITVDGVSRTYLLFAPQGDGAAPRAMVLNLHGYNSDARQQEQVSRMSDLAAREGFVVVYPQGQGDPPSWKFGPGAGGQADLAFLQAVIAEVQAEQALDPRRIYVTGISNGAEMASRVACALPDTIAAFAPVAGGYPAAIDCPATRPIPALAFHGTEDRILPYEGKPPLLLPVETWAANWAARNGCPATPAVSRQGEVTLRQWGPCREAADVLLYTIEGKGHSWPGSAMPAAITTGEIDATAVIWAFFAAH